MKSAVLSE